MEKLSINRRQAVMLVAAIGTLLAWGYTLWPTSKPVPRAAVAPAGATAQGGAPPVADTQPAPRLSAAELSMWGGLYRVVRRDPFFTAAEIAAMNRPPTVERPAPTPVALPARPLLPAYTLKLVLTAGSEKMATIGDQVVKVGDRLGEERVVEILADAVVLARGSERRRLELATGAPTGGLIQLERVR